MRRDSFVTGDRTQERRAMDRDLEIENDTILPPPVLVSPETPEVTTTLADASEVRGGGGPLLPAGALPREIEPFVRNPDFFIAMCESFHLPGTRGCRADGGPWAGDLTDDLQFARGQAVAHNENVELHAEGPQAVIVVRVAGSFVVLLP
jgi:hypothetical protein